MSLMALLAFLSVPPPVSAAAPAPSSPAPKAAASSPAAGSACQAGRSQYNAGDVLKAIANLERCVDKEPRNRDGWAALAMARLEAGRFPGAADAFGRAHALKHGDATFLARYLDALEGAGRAEERIPVLRALAEAKGSDSRHALKLLSLLDSLGAAKHPADRIFVLERLGQDPEASLQHREMLAAAYLEQGRLENAQAEYRGLLARRPEVGEYWAGLAASVEKEDRDAALECYRKAVFYSNQAGARAAYAKRIAALQAPAPQKTVAVQEPPPEKAPAVKTGEVPAKTGEVQAAKSAGAPATPSGALAKAAPAAASPAASARPAPSKPFDLKAFQDSVYKAELEKRLSALRKPEPGKAGPGSAASATGSASAPASAASASGATGTAAAAAASAPGPSASDREKAEAEKAARSRDEAKAREEKERLAKEAARKEEEERKHREKLAKEEKEKQEKLAKEAERKAKEHERFVKDSLAKVEKERLAREAADKKAQEQRERFVKDSLAKVEKERLAKEAADKKAHEQRERIVKDSLAKVEKERLAKEEADKKTREQRDRFVKDSVAKAEKERLAKEAADKKAREQRDQIVKDSLAKVEKERLAKEAAEKKLREERERIAKDSVARVEKERLAKAEAEKKAREERERFVKDSLAKVEKERLAKEAAEKKSREDRERFVKDSTAKAEKERLAKAAAEKKAQEARERFVKDSLAKVEKERLAKEAADKKAREERERFVKDSVAKVEKERLAKEAAEKKLREERERFVKDSVAKVEKERLAKEAAEKKAREELERKERLARERQERLERAIGFYRNGQLDSADALFKVVLPESPSPEAFYYAGRLHLDKGRADKALDLLLKAPKDKPDLDGLLGRAYARTGKKQEALESLERHFGKTQDAATLEEICELRKSSSDKGPWAACLEKLSGLRPMVAKYHDELAQYHRMTGDKAKSLDRYAKLLALEPSHGEANYRLGMDWGSQGVHDRSVPLLEKAVAAFPERGDAWKLLAKGQAALHRKEQAWESYRKAAERLPKDPDVARGRLAAARDLGREADLAVAYQNVLALVPQDADANLGYARLRFQAKDFAAAERHFRLGTADSKDASAWAQFGRSLLELKKFDEAAVALQKAVELGETSPGLKFDLARLYLDRGDADKAEALVKSLSAKAPSDPEPYYWLGRIAGKRQQTAVEEEFFRKANQLKPDEPRYAEAVGRLLHHRDEFRQAAAVLNPMEPRLSTEGRMILADCLAATGEGKRALDIYSALFQKEPGAILLSRRIDALVRMGRAGEAVDAARGTAFGKAPEVRFSLAKAHLSLAESHVLKGDMDLAVSLLKDALDADSHRPEYHFHLGMAYYRKEKPGKAIDAYTDALRYRVDYPDAVYWKGVCLVETGKAQEAKNFFGELSQHADARWKARGLYGLARVFESEGKWEAVEHHLVRSVAAHPTSDAMAYLSRVYQRLGRQPDAEDWARKALAVDAAHEASTVALAEALAARKQVREALGLTEAALRAKPLSCDLLVQTAKLNYEAGRMDSTLTTTGKAIQVCPQEPMPHYYAGLASRSANKPDEAKRYFKSFTKLGGDKKMLPQ